METIDDGTWTDAESEAWVRWGELPARSEPTLSSDEVSEIDTANDAFARGYGAREDTVDTYTTQCDFCETPLVYNPRIAFGCCDTCRTRPDVQEFMRQHPNGAVGNWQDVVDYSYNVQEDTMVDTREHDQFCECEGCDKLRDANGRPMYPFRDDGTLDVQSPETRPYHEIARYRTLNRDANQLAAFIGNTQASGRDMAEAEASLKIATANLECYARFNWLYSAEFLDDAFKALARGWKFACVS
jgi:hypothetical protein